MPSADDLLRALRPPEDADAHDPVSPRAAAMLERILDDDAAPSTSPPAPRRSRRRLLAGGLAAVAIAAAVILAPVGSNSPDVLARAASVLNDGDAILHIKIVRRGAGAGGVDITEESWQTTDARQLRTITSNGSESAVDWDDRTSLYYSAQGNVVIRRTDPTLFPASGPKGVDEPTGLGVGAIGDLPALLDRARRGEGTVRLLSDTEVDGRPVHQIELGFPVDVQGLPQGARSAQIVRRVFVDRDTFLPVRIIERQPTTRARVTDFLLAERLPRTLGTEAKLRFAPHPGARVEVRKHEFKP